MRHSLKALKRDRSIARARSIDTRKSWLFSLYSRHISRTQSFQEKRPIKIEDLATLKRFVAVIGRPVPELRVKDRQTDKTSTVTLAAHARRGLITYCYTAPSTLYGLDSEASSPEQSQHCILCLKHLQVLVFEEIFALPCVLKKCQKTQAEQVRHSAYQGLRF